MQKIRLTLDIDSAESRLWDLMNIQVKLRRIARVEYWISAHKRGIHIIAWLKPITVEELLRLFFGDDLKRIDLDKQRKKVGAVTDVLWNEKGRKKARKFSSLWDALKYIRREKEKR